MSTYYIPTDYIHVINCFFNSCSPIGYCQFVIILANTKFKVINHDDIY